MNETSSDFVTKRKFRLVTVVLAVPLLISLSILLGPLLIRLVRALLGPTTTVSTPIVIRGGSMTAFTTVQGGWSPPAGSMSCVDIANANSIVFTDYEVEPPTSMSWPDAITHLPKTVTPWEIDIYPHAAYGQTTGGPPDMNYGWKFMSQSHGCNTPSGISVTLSIIGGGFYPPPHLPNGANRHDNLRFLNNSQPGCMALLPATKGNDQEYCERMALVDIKLAIGTSNAAEKKPPCTDGDCSVGIGVPQ